MACCCRSRVDKKIGRNVRVAISRYSAQGPVRRNPVFLFVGGTHNVAQKMWVLPSHILIHLVGSRQTPKLRRMEPVPSMMYGPEFRK